MVSFAPGMRLLIRDAEWLCRRVDLTVSGHWALSVVGISELVRNREAVFLSNAEKRIELLDPAKTRLTADESAQYLASRLYLESLLRQTAPTDTRIYQGHRAAMDLLPYQLDAALLALGSPRQRLLIADAVGLGKTLEAGILLSELIVRGKARRILVVAIRSMLTQFQKEMWARFTIPLVRLDSIGLQRVRAEIPTRHNPFHYYDRAIISIDTLKQDNEFRSHLEEAYWDVIVIDEAQNVARRGGGASQRSELAQLLSGRSDALILLSATPHDGRRESFASLMNMLDATAIADPKSYGPEDIRGLFVRRFKKDIKNQVERRFPERTIRKVNGPQAPSAEEQAAYHCLAGLTFSSIDRRRSGTMLFKTLLEKSLFSSPAACLETIENRMATIRNQTAGGDETDVLRLEELKARVAAIPSARFSKYGNLLALLRELKWKPTATDDRLVLFTERLATLHFLKTNLERDFPFRPEQIEILHGGLNDLEQQHIVEEFGKESSPIRLLLATDLASEGINLHYLSHRLIHFDIPWSLMVFQQRNGRVDRYGQEQRPEIYYLMTEAANERIHGDLRILELLIEKDREAQSSIGDPSAFLNLYDQELEEKAVASAMESGGGAAFLQKQMSGFDPFEVLLGTGLPETAANAEEQTASRPSLFADDYQYLKTALRHLQESRSSELQWEAFDDTREIALTLPEELEARFRFLPREVRPREEQLMLSADPAVLQEEIRLARKEENSWPARQYLWSLHPVVEWTNDRLAAHFGRHQAPVVFLGSLDSNETIVLLAGQIPNHRGQALVHRWFGVQFRAGTFERILALEEVLARTRLPAQEFPNPMRPFDEAALADLLPEAVRRGIGYLIEERGSFLNKTMPAVEEKLAELQALEARHQQQLDEEFAGLIAAGTRKEHKLREVRRAFQDYREWIRSTLEIEEHPHLTVAMVFGGD